jgi:hypothetical protein
LKLPVVILFSDAMQTIKVEESKIILLLNYYAMKTLVSGGIPPVFLTMALDGGEWAASPPKSHNCGKSPWCPLDRMLGRH